MNINSFTNQAETRQQIYRNKAGPNRWDIGKIRILGYVEAKEMIKDIHKNMVQIYP